MRGMLAAADAAIVPALAIAAFAGLRLAEVSRLDWREVRLSEKLIVVGAENAKTAARRLVPISDNLAVWLAPYSKGFGPVNPCQEELRGNVGHALGLRCERAAARAKVARKRNGFRHSYISYRVATLKRCASRGAGMWQLASSYFFQLPGAGDRCPSQSVVFHPSAQAG
jgi:integrase